MGSIITSFYHIKSKFALSPNVAAIRARCTAEGGLSVPIVESDAAYPLPSKEVGAAGASRLSSPDRFPWMSSSSPHDRTAEGKAGADAPPPVGATVPELTWPARADPPLSISLGTSRSAAPSPLQKHTGADTPTKNGGAGREEGEPTPHDIVRARENGDGDRSAAEYDEEDEGDDAMGPMDCADADAYYFAPEEAYRHVESATFRAPGAASYSSRALRERYTYDQYRRGGGESEEEEEEETAAAATATAAAAAAARQQAETLPPGEEGGERGQPAEAEHSSAADKDEEGDSSNKGATRTEVHVLPPAASAAKEPSTPCATAPDSPLHRRFRPLVTELRWLGTRSHLRADCALSWRDVGRVVRVSGGSSAAAGAAKADAPPDSGKDEREEGERRFLFYLGPPQRMSYHDLWQQVQDFGWGLRALGLKPGDMLGVLDDPRWEWLVTLYGAWSQCMVVVLLPGDSREVLQRAAVDTLRDMKVVVCKSSAQRMVRDAYAHAARRTATKTRQPRQPLVVVTSPLPAFDIFSALPEEDAPADLSREEEEEALWWSEVGAYGKRKQMELTGRLAARPAGPRKPARATSHPSPAAVGEESVVSGASSVVRRPSTLLSLRTVASPPISSTCHTAVSDGGTARHTRGAAAAATLPLPSAELRATDLALIVYPDGEPRGVMLTHGALRASAAAYVERMADLDLYTAEVLQAGESKSSTFRPSDPSLRRDPAVRPPSFLLYLPIHHMAQFSVAAATLLRGHMLSFGAPHTLLDHGTHPHGDLKEYRPLAFMGPPCVMERVARTVRESLSGGLTKFLFDIAYESKRQALQRGHDTPLLNRSIFRLSRQLLGGRCLLLLVTDAPLRPQLQEYLQVVTGASVAQLYALTETAGCGLVQRYWGGTLGDMGGPLSPVEAKLRDVGCWSHHSARPSGELLLRGAVVMAGYYQQPERTASVLEKGGWLHTGDVVERCADGAFVLVGRLKAVAKNTRGISIALERLEQLLGQHTLCAADGAPAFCLLVHPHRSYVAALLRTTEQQVEAFLQRKEEREEEGEKQSPLLHDPTVAPLVVHSLAAMAKEKGVAAYLVPRRVHLVFGRWTSAEGLLSATGRLHRPAMEAHYAAAIMDLFAQDV